MDTVIVRIGMVVGDIPITGTMDTGALVLAGVILTTVVDITVHLTIMEEDIIIMDTDMDMVTVMPTIEGVEILVIQQEEIDMLIQDRITEQLEVLVEQIERQHEVAPAQDQDLPPDIRRDQQLDVQRVDLQQDHLADLQQDQRVDLRQDHLAVDLQVLEDHLAEDQVAEDQVAEDQVVEDHLVGDEVVDATNY